MLIYDLRNKALASIVNFDQTVILSGSSLFIITSTALSFFYLFLIWTYCSSHIFALEFYKEFQEKWV